jgi:protein-tyrosine-phosphatase
MRKQKVLFLCRQNSARSQMAEAFIDMDEQYPKDLKTCMGKVGFNHSIIV